MAAKFIWLSEIQFVFQKKRRNWWFQILMYLTLFC